MFGKKGKSDQRDVVFAGGVFGLVAFLIFGLLPSLVYGGYAGVVLASAIYEGPIHEHFLAQALVVFGVLVGLLVTASLFVLGGAIAGGGLAALLGAGRGKALPVEATSEHKSSN